MNDLRLSQFITFDTFLNLVLGISLVLVPDFYNRLLFGHELISHWILILVGISFLWITSWEWENFWQGRSKDLWGLVKLEKEVVKTLISGTAVIIVILALLMLALAKFLSLSGWIVLGLAEVYTTVFVVWNWSRLQQ